MNLTKILIMIAIISLLIIVISFIIYNSSNRGFIPYSKIQSTSRYTVEINGRAVPVGVFESDDVICLLMPKYWGGKHDRTLCVDTTDGTVRDYSEDQVRAAGGILFLGVDEGVAYSQSDSESADFHTEFRNDNQYYEFRISKSEIMKIYK